MSAYLANRVSILTLALMTVASVVSLNGLPLMAVEGLSMIYYILFATFIFLLPAAMVAAELGSTFANEGGGVYTWVKTAFGSRWGFTAIWLQWTQSMFWYPTVLGYAASCLAYLFMDPTMANNGKYTGLVILILYWLAIVVAFKGTTAINALTKYGVIFGTILPGVAIIILGALWVDQGNPIAFLIEDVPTQTADMATQTGEALRKHAHPTLFPHITGLGSIAFLAGFILFFSGVEVQAVQVTNMDDPARNYPIAMLLASAIILVIFGMGSFAVAAIIPGKDLSLTAGLMQAFDAVFDKFNLKFLTPVMGLLMAFGTIGGVMSWVTGTSRGILATAKEGEIPPVLARVNAHGAPVIILIIQGVIVSILASLYLIMEDVSVAFFILSAMTATFYISMYMLMFVAAIYLRITKPDLPRTFKVPGGVIGMSLIGGIGFLGMAFALVVSFFPPSNLPVGNPPLYVGLVASGLIVFIGVPMVIQSLKKTSWKTDQQAK